VLIYEQLQLFICAAEQRVVFGSTVLTECSKIFYALVFCTQTNESILILRDVTRAPLYVETSALGYVPQEGRKTLF
jgi:hypothetical protein